MQRHQTFSASETKEIGRCLAKILKPNSIVAFFGDLGAGKTTLIKGTAEYFGIPTNIVCSPTFVYLNIYEGSIPLYHFDLYRIKNASDFQAMGFDEFFSSQGACLIEWAERIEEILPEHVIKVHMSSHDEYTREITIGNL